MTENSIVSMLSLITAVLFILALRGLSAASTSRRGNMMAMVGMGLAVLTPLVLYGLRGGSDEAHYLVMEFFAILFGGTIGLFIARKIDMSSLPQLVAAFHSLVGLSAVFIASAVFAAPYAFGISAFVGEPVPASRALEMSLGAAVGAVTFTGSIVAFLKLQGIMSGKSIRYKLQNPLNLTIAVIIIAMIAAFIIMQTTPLFIAIVVASFLIGYLLTIPIGGADMPVIVSMLNSYSGWAAAGIGFTIDNNLLIMVGALVGTSGAILSNIMCKGMNRSLLNVVLGGTGDDSAVAGVSSDKSTQNVKLCGPEDAGFIVKNAESVVIVPGYGMAVAHAQHAIKELADLLKVDGTSVKYAIHPVAGRMPGHMNVLLAEADIPYEDVFEIDEINHEFGSTDVVIVIGANDITNPAAKNDPTSPIYGMPILEVGKAKTILFVKRSLGSGYAGIDNQLFYQSNTMMVLGDAKKVVETVIKAIKR